MKKKLNNISIYNHLKKAYPHNSAIESINDEEYTYLGFYNDVKQGNVDKIIEKLGQIDNVHLAQYQYMSEREWRENAHPRLLSRYDLQFVVLTWLLNNLDDFTITKSFEGNRTCACDGWAEMGYFANGIYIATEITYDEEEEKSWRNCENAIVTNIEEFIREDECFWLLSILKHNGYIDKITDKDLRKTVEECLVEE